MDRKNLKVVKGADSGGDDIDPTLDVLIQAQFHLRNELRAAIEQADRTRGQEYSRNAHSDALSELKDYAWRLSDIHRTLIEREKMDMVRAVARTLVREARNMSNTLENIPDLLDYIFERMGK